MCNMGKFVKEHYIPRYQPARQPLRVTRIRHEPHVEPPPEWVRVLGDPTPVEPVVIWQNVEWVEVGR